jgi:hypothetical protein
MNIEARQEGNSTNVFLSILTFGYRIYVQLPGLDTWSQIVNATQRSRLS